MFPRPTSKVIFMLSWCRSFCANKVIFMLLCRNFCANKGFLMFFTAPTGGLVALTRYHPQNTF